MAREDDTYHYYGDGESGANDGGGQQQTTTTIDRGGWVPDGHGSWMPDPSTAPAGKHWDPTMANWVDNAVVKPPVENPINPGQLPSPFTSQFTAPGMVNLGGPAGIPYIPQTPQFNAPAYRQAPAFQGPAPFQAPSMQDVLSDPGYQFPLTQGLGAYSNNRAAQGLWGTGATGKGLQDYSQNYANQFYGNIYNRDLNTYQTNFKNAIDSYNTNYGTQYADPNAYNYKAAQDAFAPQILGYQTQAAAGQHQSDLDYSHAYQKWLDDFDQKYKTGSFLRDTAAS